MSTVPVPTPTTFVTAPNRTESNSEHIATLPAVTVRCRGGNTVLFSDNQHLSEAQIKKIVILENIMFRACCSDDPNAALVALKHGFNLRNRYCKLHPDDGINFTISFAQFVVAGNCFNVLKMFFENGHNLQNYVLPTDTPLLQYAAYNLNIEMTEWLIKKGADVHALDTREMTALEVVLGKIHSSLYKSEQTRMITLLKWHMQFRVTGAHTEIDVAELTCPICKDCEEVKWCRTRCCSQVFHVNCLKKWHKCSTGKDCPLCRTKMRGANRVGKQLWTPTYNLCQGSSTFLNKGLIFQYLN